MQPYHDPNIVKLNGEAYVLAKSKEGGKPVYASGSRIEQKVPSDDFEIAILDWSKGMGIDFYYSQNCLTTVKGRLGPGPKVTTLSVHTASDSPIRYFYEIDQTSPSTNRHLYGISPTAIAKVRITDDPPTKATATVGPWTASSPFLAADRLGQPLISLAGGQLQMIMACNNADRLVRSTPASGTVDPWGNDGTVTKGASHFVPLPSGKIARLVSDMSAGTFQDRCEVSLLAAGADPCVTGDFWGDDFPVEIQTVRGMSIFAFDELLIVGKEDNWFAAVEREDGTLQWRELLPDAMYASGADPEDWTHHKGLQWHAKMMLPTPHSFWRHFLFGAIPVGPDSIPDNYGDEPNLTDQIRYGTIPTAAHGGQWLYEPYNIPGGGYYIMAMRERIRGEDVVAENIWHPIVYKSTGLSQAVHVQRKGVGGPRLFWGDGATGGENFCWIDIADDLSPYRPGASYGDANADGSIFGNEHIFDSLVLLREVRLNIESGDANLSWQPQVQRDGGSVEDTASSLTATGSSFWAARTNDTCRRARFGLKWAGNGSYDPAGNKTRVRKMVVHGSYLPDVSDQISFVIDVEETARQERKSHKEIRDEIRALVKVGAKTFEDPHDVSLEVLVDSDRKTSFSSLAEMEGEQFIEVKARVLEYS